MLDNLGITKDSSQYVVKVMGNTSGKCPDCLHFLSPEQLRIQLLLLCYIPLNGDKVDSSAAVGVDRENNGRYNKFFTVFLFVNQFTPPGVSRPYTIEYIRIKICRVDII